MKRLALHDKDGNVTVTMDASTGNVSVNTKGKITFDAEDDGTMRSQSKVDVESPVTTLKGGDVTINGTVTPTGMGALCGLPFCMFSGAPHSGSTAKECQ